MQVVDKTDKLEFADLNIFVPADTFKGSSAEKISKRTSFEASLLEAVAEAAGNLKLPQAACLTYCAARAAPRPPPHPSLSPCHPQFRCNLTCN